MPLSKVQPERYKALLEAKVARVSELLAPFAPPTPNVFASPATGFRMRAEFRVWHDGDALDYVMFNPADRKTPVVINAFPIACERIQQLMPQLIESLKDSTVLRRKLFQVEFLSTLPGDTLVTLVYHRRLEDDWEAAATALAAELGVQIVGRSRKQKCVLGRDHVNETLAVHGRKYHYRQYEQAFTQPNASVNTHMIEWACDRARDLGDDLLELYCGNGNFTLPLARHFEHVIATELSKTSARAARENMVENDVANVQMIRLSAEEVTEAMRGVRQFRRLAELPQPLSDYNLRTVFVDPPRAGLDDNTQEMVTGFDHIIYISCNPETLAGNLAHICTSHEITEFALFDQFPYTDHMECGVFLRRKSP